MNQKAIDAREKYIRLWVRGRVLWVNNTQGLGKEFKDEHYWILVSRDEINWNTELPIIAVPVVSHRSHTRRHAADIEVSEEHSPTGRAMLALCGQVKALDRRIRRVKPTKKRLCEDDVLILIERKLIEVLGLNERWTEKEDELLKGALEALRRK